MRYAFAVKLNVTALAITVGLGWGAVMLLVGALNYLFPPYGQTFLEVVASLYPGYRPTGTLLSVLVGTVYGLVDGILAGVVIGWMYNGLARRLR